MLQRIALILNSAPAMFDKVADILMIACLRMPQYIVTIICAEAGEGFRWCQVLQLCKRKQFAGAVVLPGCIHQFAIFESGRGEIVMGVDHGDGVGKGNAVWFAA